MPFSIWVANESWNKLNLLKFRICILIVHTRRKIESTTYRQFQLVNFNMNYSSGYVGSTFLKKKHYLRRITFAEFCNAIVYHSVHGKNKLSPIRANVQFHLFFFSFFFSFYTYRRLTRNVTPAFPSLWCHSCSWIHLPLADSSLVASTGLFSGWSLTDWTDKAN